jgi:hydrogenase maturation protease
MNKERRPHWLVFGVGNPSRGDDALGPMFIEQLEAWSAAMEELPVDLSILTDFQWQIEHALDLAGVDVALFVDASVRAAAPFELEPLQPMFDVTYSTHSLSPACVLAVAQQLGVALPQSWLLTIPGEEFELGAPMSGCSQDYLGLAFDYFRACARAGAVTASHAGAST